MVTGDLLAAWDLQEGRYMEWEGICENVFVVGCVWVGMCLGWILCCDQEDVPCTDGVQTSEDRGPWGARG